MGGGGASSGGCGRSASQSGSRSGSFSYEEFTRLAETRLAQNTFNYIKTANLTLA